MKNHRTILTLAGGDYLLGAAVQAAIVRQYYPGWDHITYMLPHEKYPSLQTMKGLGLVLKDVVMLSADRYLGHPWTAKVSALLHLHQTCPHYTEVLYLDADAYPVCAQMPDWLGFPRKQATALFWRDFATMSVEHPVFAAINRIVGCADAGAEVGNGFEIESGQMFFKLPEALSGLRLMEFLCTFWRELFTLVHGDKDLWRIAFALAKCPWALASAEIGVTLDNNGHGRVIHHYLTDGDLNHTEVIQHRVHSKLTMGDNWWRPGVNTRPFQFLNAIKRRMDGQ